MTYVSLSISYSYSSVSCCLQIDLLSAEGALHSSWGTAFRLLRFWDAGSQPSTRLGLTVLKCKQHDDSDWTWTFNSRFVIFSVNHLVREQHAVSTETLNSWTFAFKSLDKVKLSSPVKHTVHLGAIWNYIQKSNNFCEYLKCSIYGLTVIVLLMQLHELSCLKCASNCYNCVHRSVFNV